MDITHQKHPKKLRKGDTIAIVSTARKVSSKELAPAVLFVKKMGLEVHLGKTIEAKDNQYAGDDSLRAQDFQEVLDNPNIKAIWCARGGYGTVRIVDLLDFSQVSYASQNGLLATVMLQYYTATLIGLISLPFMGRCV